MIEVINIITGGVGTGTPGDNIVDYVESTTGIVIGQVNYYDDGAAGPFVFYFNI